MRSTNATDMRKKIHVGGRLMHARFIEIPPGFQKRKVGYFPNIYYIFMYIYFIYLYLYLFIWSSFSYVHTVTLAVLLFNLNFT